MAKYLVVYSYQDETQPLLREKYNFIAEIADFDMVFCEFDLYLSLGFKLEHYGKSGFIIENLVKLGG